MDNEIIKYLVRLQRLAQGVSVDVARELAELIKETLKQIEGDIDLTVDHIRIIRQKAGELTRGITVNVNGVVQEGINVSADLSPSVVRRGFAVSDQFSFTQPPLGVIERIKASDFQGRPWSQYGEAITVRTAKRIETALREALRSGEGIVQARNRVRNVSNLAIADATKLARTSINSAANRSLMESYKSNRSLIKGWRFLSTLDQRTSQICMGLSGQEFELNTGPLPPRHPNCRSIALPVTRTFQELGIDIPDLDSGQQASQTGPVSADLNYEGWLRTQSSDFQKETLGPTKYKAWRNGVPLKAFATDNRPLTINELRSSYAF